MTPSENTAPWGVDTQPMQPDLLELPDAVALPAVPVVPSEARLRFTGSGAEYFRIWSVNLTLTILTLGLYGPWAKVRRLQYFYRHTELDGAVFDYVASPTGILFGRVLGLMLLVLYYLAFEYAPWASVVVTLLLAAVLPYLFWQSNRFKARNTRYRGLSFSFLGTVGAAYRVYLPPILITFIPTLVAVLWLDPKAEKLVLWFSLFTVLVLPILHAMYRRYVQSYLCYGKTPFVFSGKGRDFAAVWAWGLGVMTVGALSFMLLLFILGGFSIVIAGKGAYATIFMVLAGLFSAWLAYLMVGSYFTARFQKLVWEKTTIGELGFRCDLSAKRLLYLQITNTLWVILSLGIYRPYAAIRLARFRLQSMSVIEAPTLDRFIAGVQQGRAGATGESAAELFEMDVGL